VDRIADTQKGNREWFPEEGAEAQLSYADGSDISS